MASTTIKVPVELRDRINSSARSRGTTAAGLLSELLDERERLERFAAVRAAYARLPASDDYWGETRAWGAAQAAWPLEHE